MLNGRCDTLTDGPMGYLLNFDDHTVERLRTIIDMLNEESQKGSIIVVEGKRDAEALAGIGFTGNPTVFHHFKGIADFLDYHESRRKKMILLLDMDRTGKYLTRKIISQLQFRKHNVSLFYKNALAKITNGRVRHMEDLAIFAPRLSGVTGSRRDLYFYT